MQKGNFFRSQNIYQRFAVVGHARTGSNYLLAGLKSSNHLRIYSEIFAGHNREKGKDFDLILSKAYRKEGRHIKAVGFKLFYNHFTQDEWSKFLSQKEFIIIHLTRENCLRTIVSLDIAFKTGQWRSVAKVTQPIEKSVLLDTSKLIERFERIQNFEILARDRFKDRRMLEVVYENLVRKPREVFQQVCEFLSVDDIDSNKIVLSRQNPENLKRLIINYDEVYRLLKNTKFAKYLSS